MPILTAHRFYTIALIAGLATSIVPIVHTGRPDNTPNTANVQVLPAKPQVAPKMCSVRRGPLVRTPVYKRYLNQTPVSRYVHRES